MNKTERQLLDMDNDALLAYFKKHKTSHHELDAILDHLRLRPVKSAKQSYVKFAANEIAELGRYIRIVRGVRNRGQPITEEEL